MTNDKQIWVWLIDGDEQARRAEPRITSMTFESRAKARDAARAIREGDWRILRIRA